MNMTPISHDRPIILPGLKRVLRDSTGLPITHSQITDLCSVSTYIYDWKLLE